MKFSEFKGNERVVSYFQKAISHEHLGHAYLFSGQEGVGKATLARLISQTLLCKNPTKDGPCETCSACHKFDSGNHPDFHEFVPDGTYFKIDQVREIIHQASLKPVESRWKTFLLESVHYMRDEASNAMLKVLEEPPGQTILFLITETAEVLLPTIRSRCQHFPFQPLPQEEIVDWLVKNKEIPSNEAASLARYSYGSIGRALGVNVEQDREKRDRILGAVEAAVAPKSYYTVIDAVKSITVERAEMRERLLILEEIVRDLMVLKNSPDAKLIHQDARNRLLPLANRLTLSAIEKFYDDLLQTREGILKINANVGLSMQALLLPLRAKS